MMAHVKTIATLLAIGAIGAGVFYNTTFAIVMGCIAAGCFLVGSLILVYMSLYDVFKG